MKEKNEYTLHNRLEGKKKLNPEIQDMIGKE